MAQVEAFASQWYAYYRDRLCGGRAPLAAAEFQQHISAKWARFTLSTQLSWTDPGKWVHVGTHSLPTPNYEKYSRIPPLDAETEPGK